MIFRFWRLMPFTTKAWAFLYFYLTMYTSSELAARRALSVLYNYELRYLRVYGFRILPRGKHKWIHF